MLDGAKKNLEAIGKDETYFQGKQLTADSNYHSLNSLTVCRDEKIDAYIPDIQFRKRDPRFAEQERFKDGAMAGSDPTPSSSLHADFSFDADKQVYLCPQGKELTCHARNQVNRHRTYDVYHARVEDCAACPLRAQLPEQAGYFAPVPFRPVDTQQPNLIDEMKARSIANRESASTPGRLGIVEPVFANICVQKRMSRFTLRNKTKSRCTMAVVRAGAQYRENPHLWSDPLTPGESKIPVQPPSTRETGLSARHGTGKALYKISFSTVSLVE